MATNQRLRRYLADELGDCRDEDLTQRMDELDTLDENASATIEADVGTLSALANGTRYKIVRLLHEADSKLCVCELSPLLDVSDSAISQALSQLTDAGLIERHKEGKWRKYETTRRATALLVAIDGTRPIGR